MTLYHTMQKNIVIGQKNTLRVMLSLVHSVDNDLLEAIADKLQDTDDEKLQEIAEAHAAILKMNPATVLRHFEKIRDGRMEEIVWPD